MLNFNLCPKKQEPSPSYLDQMMLWMLMSALEAHCVLCFLTEKVTEIKTNIFVTSFGPVSDTEMVRITLQIH